MLIIIACIVFVLVLIFFFIQSTRNRAITLEEAVKTATSDVKVQEKRRIDLIYNLVDCVKNYDAHEAEVLSGLAEKMKQGSGDEEDSQVHASLNATAYQYPELKSSTLYQNLMNELSMTENLIARHRENYNGAVNDYSRYIRQFPVNSLLPMSGYQEQIFERLDFSASVDAPQNLFGNGGGRK